MLLANNEIIKKIRSFDQNIVTAELREQFKAGVAEDSQENNRVLTVAGSTASISVAGMLTKTYSFMTWWFGGTAYSDINGALALAESDPDITDIVIQMDSGGGHVAGLFDTIAQMQAVTKPLSCKVSGNCCSAAYALASQCNSITASSEADTIGSIGIVVDAYIDEEVVSITSTNAPKKRPDASTEDGVKEIRAQLDEYEELFLEAIAEGRGTDVDNVIKNYGQGATTIARNALKSGMIDSIGATNSNVQGDPDNLTTATIEENITMNAAELKAQHPETYAAIFADGEKSGKTNEQERVSAFAAIGKASGAMDLAMACIEDGTEPSATVTMKFEAKRMEMATLNAMAADNPDTSSVDTATPDANAELEKATLAAFDGEKMEQF